MTHHKHHHSDQQPEGGKPPELDAAGQAEDGAGVPAASESALVAERDDLLSRLQRLSADYVNYQKRITREISTIREFANENLLRDLVGVLDDIDRAYEAGSANHDKDDALLKGLSLVRQKALEVLGRYGLTTIAAQSGQEFDPQRHEALMRQTADVKHPTVLQEVHRGYELKGRILRPAKVVVGTPAEEPQPSDQSAEPSGK